ncbi:MAG: DegV family EDD domain-containing protein [Deltaproteobacteria bacterium]|nr:DegV family EDD domain-containing protein [Deltaproteobacteria bacterium]
MDSQLHAMREDFRQAIIAGVERLTACADLLDRINVFPIADGDTGRNFVISLSPLRRPERDRKIVARDLLLSARGNSGNIASAFFQCFIQSDSLEDLPDTVRLGRDRSRKAIPEPQEGTMLSFFDALAAGLPDAGVLSDPERIAELLTQLETVVRNTTDQQQKLRKAGVVDAGALGLFLYFEGFFHLLAGGRVPFRLLPEAFRDRLQISPSYGGDRETGYCVDTVLQGEADAAETGQMLTTLGESVIVTRTDACYKIHFHTQDREDARRKLVRLGKVIGWAEDDLHQQTSAFARTSREPAIHIMTDAAASLSRQDAKDLGISLLDSYITIGDRCLPETYFSPEELYNAMRSGQRVTTAQASVFERHQFYASVMSRYAQVLYLCVGSAFTGNYPVVMDWKRQHDPEDRLVVLDTGAASGRLGVLARAVAACASEADEAGRVIAYARQALTRCEEYVFLDRLEYLAAGGRLSKTGAFFGDMLHMKPIVSPMAEGVRKVGIARNRKDQLRFALDALDCSLKQDNNALILLEYSDNRPWVDEVGLEVAKRYPEARIVVHSLSLTSGAHMGPGTWALAFLPDLRMQ